MIKCTKCSEEDELRKIRKCHHSYCCKCLVEYLKKNAIPGVKCMSNGCGGVIPDRVVRECLSNDQIEVYEKLSIKGISKNVIKCLTESCPFFAEVVGGDVVFECSYCGAPNCNKCKERHYINDCGRNIADEEAIEARARQTMKETKRKAFEKLKATLMLIPNPESFECPICYTFVLPRVGYILKNCLHCVCKVCLERSIGIQKFLSQCACPISGCDNILDDGELYALNPERHIGLMENESFLRYFRCKTADCSGVWDASSNKTTHKCPTCNKTNCLACQDIHEGVSCIEFKASKKYKSVKDTLKMFGHLRKVQCHVCKKLLIQNGGCNALYCAGCGCHTCVFTGKIAGRHIATKCFCKGAPNCTKQDQFCGCTSKVPCDPLCAEGCFPENLTSS